MGCLWQADPFGSASALAAMFKFAFVNSLKSLISRAVNPHSFFADRDLAVFLKADPDPAAF